MADVQKLTAEQKRFAVQCFACCMTPQQVADAVKEEFNIVVQRSHIVYYDAGRNQKLKKDLAELFEKTRKEFCEETGKHAIAYVGYRLGRLQRMSEKAEQSKNFVLASQLLEQAAKDAGGLYTNKREHSGPGGGAISIETSDATLTDEQRVARLAAIFDAGRARRDRQAAGGE